MLTFISVAAIVISGSWVIYQGWTSLQNIDLFSSIAYFVCGTFALIAAKKIYDERDITASFEALNNYNAEWL